MASHRKTQVEEELAHTAALFFQRESNAQSLMTITRASIAPDFANATIYFTVIPTSAEDSALSFAKRKRSDFRDFLKSHASFKRLPHIDFEIDEGEKSRQRLDDISRDAL